MREYAASKYATPKGARAARLYANKGGTKKGYMK
jgi:hypothetical protein